MKLLDESAPRPPSRGPVAVGIIVVVVLAAAGLWFWRAHAPGTPAATAPATAPPATEPGSSVPHPARPSTGSVEVTSDRPQAKVFLDGERLGAAPVTAPEVSGGTHHVRVEAAGRPPIEREINVLPGRASRVDARFGAAPPRLHVTADVDGASVFLDRKFLGRTPLSVDAPAGSHALQVSADGLPPHSETIELVSGETLSRDVRLHERAPLDASVSVEHKHAFGSCQGTLHATDAGVRYDTDGKDAFSVPLEDVATLEVDYLNKNLELKVRGGRRYNFRGDPDALLLFQRAVQERLPKK